MSKKVVLRIQWRKKLSVHHRQRREFQFGGNTEFPPRNTVRDVDTHDLVHHTWRLILQFVHAYATESLATTLRAGLSLRCPPTRGSVLLPRWRFGVVNWYCVAAGLGTCVDEHRHRRRAIVLLKICLLPISNITCFFMLTSTTTLKAKPFKRANHARY